METIWRMLVKGSLFSFLMVSLQRKTIRYLGKQNTDEVKGRCLLTCPATGAIHELVQWMENVEVRAGVEGRGERGGEEMGQQEVGEVATL